MTSHTIFCFLLGVIGVLCLCIMAECALCGTQMVQKWTSALVLVYVVLMSIWGILGLNFSILFQAEIFAILMCCRICIDKDYKG